MCVYLYVCMCVCDCCCCVCVCVCVPVGANHQSQMRSLSADDVLCSCRAVQLRWPVPSAVAPRADVGAQGGPWRGKVRCW